MRLALGPWDLRAGLHREVPIDSPDRRGVSLGYDAAGYDRVSVILVLPVACKNALSDLPLRVAYSQLRAGVCYAADSGTA